MMGSTCETSTGFGSLKQLGNAVDTHDLFLLTGLILPIWKDIPGDNPRIYRAQCVGGDTYLGRALSLDEAAVLRGTFISVDKTDPRSIISAVVEGAQSVDLGRGLSLARKRVAGNMRLEITGADRPTLDWLRCLGCFTEIHQFVLRVFVPHGDEDVTQGILETILGQHLHERSDVAA